MEKTLFFIFDTFFEFFQAIFVSRRCQSNDFERKSQSNQSNAIERDRIIAVRLSNAIESQSNGRFLGNIRLRSIDFRLVRLVRLIINYIQFISDYLICRSNLRRSQFDVGPYYYRRYGLFDIYSDGRIGDRPH